MSDKPEGNADAKPDGNADAKPDDKIALKYPFTCASGARIEVVNVRRLKVKDLKKISREAPNDIVEQELLGISRMCGLVPEDLEEMDAADYQAVRERFRNVMGVA